MSFLAMLNLTPLLSFAKHEYLLQESNEIKCRLPVLSARQRFLQQLRYINLLTYLLTLGYNIRHIRYGINT